MGQRLNIEIKRKSDNKVLANAYYHWSAYTESSIDLALEIMSNIAEYEDMEINTMKAVQLLQTTGAGVIEEDYNNLTKEEKEICRVGKRRNLGLIGISEKQINDNEKYSEFSLSIVLDDTDKRDNLQKLLKPKDYVEFRVYYKMSDEDIIYFLKDYNDSDDMKKYYAKNRTNMYEFDMNKMSRDDLLEFKKAIKEIENNDDSRLDGIFRLKSKNSGYASVDDDKFYGIIY